MWKKVGGGPRGACAPHAARGARLTGVVCGGVHAGGRGGGGPAPRPRGDRSRMKVSGLLGFCRPVEMRERTWRRRRVTIHGPSERSPPHSRWRRSFTRPWIAIYIGPVLQVFAEVRYPRFSGSDRCVLGQYLGRIVQRHAEERTDTPHGVPHTRARHQECHVLDRADIQSQTASLRARLSHPERS